MDGVGNGRGKEMGEEELWRRITEVGARLPPLFPSGEEIDMDLVSLEQSDSPILWIRIDSAMTILRQVKIEQVSKRAD